MNDLPPDDIVYHCAEELLLVDRIGTSQPLDILSGQRSHWSETVLTSWPRGVRLEDFFEGHLVLAACLGYSFVGHNGKGVAGLAVWHHDALLDTKLRERVHIMVRVHDNA